MVQQVGTVQYMKERGDRPVHGGNLRWAAQVAHCSPADILDFSASINPLGPPHSAIAAIQAHLPDLRAYPDPHYSDLRQGLAHYHRIDPAWICPGNGSAELLTWASRELASHGATAVLTPAFGDYGRSIRAFDGEIVTCPIMSPKEGGTGAVDNEAVNEPVMDLADILKQSPLRETDCNGIIINNPHNPTGHLWRRDDILALVDRFALVVVDEAFMDFLPPDRQQSVIEVVTEYANVVVLRSLTKFYSLPGLRIGYAIAHPDRLRQWQEWRDPWPVNILAAATASTVLTDTNFQQQTFSWLDNARPLLFNGFQQMPGLFPYPGAVNYLLVETNRSAIDLQRHLLERDRILIRDCVSFPELGDRYFRVAVRTEEENKRLLAAVKGF